MSATPHLRLRQIAWVALLPSFIDSIGAGAVIPLFALRALDLGASVTTAALIVALIGFGQLSASLPTGALIARIGERRALIIAGVGQVLAMITAWLTNELWLYGVGVLILGLSLSVWTQARQGFLIIATPPGLHARVLSTLGGVFRAGLLVGPILGAFLIHAYGMPVVFALAAFTSALATLFVIVTPDVSASARAAEADSAAGRGGMFAALRDNRRVFATIGTSAAIIGASRNVRMIMLPLWGDHIGLSASNISLLLGIAAAVDLSLFYAAGWLMDHHGRAIAGAIVTGTAALGLMALPLTNSYAGVLAVAIFVGIGNGFGSGIMLTLGADTSPEVGRAQYLGAWRLCVDSGYALSASLAGALTAVLPLAAASVALGVVFVGGTGWTAYWVNGLDRLRAAHSAARNARTGAP